MNPHYDTMTPEAIRIPHTRGDEPNLAPVLQGELAVFPTRVGMNLHRPQQRLATHSIPHTRGDEPPSNAGLPVANPYSPHAWG